jgi:hypothetical protein
VLARARRHRVIALWKVVSRTLPGSILRMQNRPVQPVWRAAAADPAGKRRMRLKDLAITMQSLNW